MAIYHDKFIEAVIKKSGKISTYDIMSVFPLDVKRASEILKFYSLKNSGSIEYNDIERLYKRSETFKPLYINCQPDEVIYAVELLF